MGFSFLKLFPWSCGDVWQRLRDEDFSLQLHLDVNGVVLGQETIEGKITPPEVYANNMLAQGTYHNNWSGKEVREEESYKQYVWTKVLSGENSDPVLRKNRKEKLANFVLDLEKNSHPLAEEVQKQFSHLKNILEKSPVFPGLKQLVNTLKDKEVKHQFVFRTFGGDGEYICQYFKEHFPTITFQTGTFDEEGKFSYKNEVGEECSTSTPQDIYRLMSQGDWMIQDNFQRWRKGQEVGNFGKFFPFTSDSNERIISLFLDDNLEITKSDEERSIVCCYDLSKKQNVSTQTASYRLHKVNPIDAALDSNYLINTVSKKAQEVLNQLHPQTQSSMWKIGLVAAAAVTIIASIFLY